MNLAPILTFLLLLPTLGVRAEEAETTAEEAIASLTDPKKLATLKGERAVNPRFQKCIWYLSQRTINRDPAVVIDKAMELNKTAGTAYAKAVKRALMEGLYAHNKYGGVGSFEGNQEMKQGKSATITKGEYAGQEATADHYIPRAVCSELENQIINLRLCPALVNSRKGDKVEKPSLEFAKLLHRDGLLSQDGFDAVKSAYDKDNPMFNSSSYSITPPNNKYTIQPKGEDEVRADMEKDFPLPSSAPAK